MKFTYMKCKSDHAFKAQKIAFLENPRKRTGMHQNCGFGLRKDQLFHKDFHLFSRKYIIQHKYVKWGKLMTRTESLRFLVKNLVSWALKGHSKSAWGLTFIKDSACLLLVSPSSPPAKAVGPARPGGQGR